MIPLSYADQIVEGSFFLGAPVGSGGLEAARAHFVARVRDPQACARNLRRVRQLLPDSGAQVRGAPGVARNLLRACGDTYARLRRDALCSMGVRHACLARGIFSSSGVCAHSISVPATQLVSALRRNIRAVRL
jgi:hypothetical protein